MGKSAGRAAGRYGDTPDNSGGLPSDRDASKMRRQLTEGRIVGCGAAVVAGHVCLDIIPSLRGAMPSPGGLAVCGPATISTGGAVSNVGIALAKLGTRTRLAARVGDDTFGRNIVAILKAASSNLDVGIVPVPGEISSYSVVINPLGIDRSFLHCPGANDSFDAGDVPDSLMDGATLLHFGYPPLMSRMRADGGAECIRLFRRARAAGLTVTLDMARPDPASPSGRIDWRAWLTRVLPETDVFLPSMDELLFMLDRPRFEALEARPGGLPDVLYDPDLASRLAGEILDMGAAAAVVKLGAAGLYLRSASDPARISSAGAAFPRDGRWAGREIYAPCFRVEVTGTTGSGDCTIAGFLAALMRCETPERTVEFAVAVGACCVEAPDATGGVRGWDETWARIAAGWKRRDPAPGFAGWRDFEGLRIGPRDAGGKGHG